MVEFLAGVTITALLFIIYIKTRLISKINGLEKKAYRKGWESCRKDLLKLLSSGNCKESDS